MADDSLMERLPEEYVMAECEEPHADEEPRLQPAVLSRSNVKQEKGRQSIDQSSLHMENCCQPKLQNS